MATYWRDKLNGDPLPWLLGPDPANPGVRYFALTDLEGRTSDDVEVVEARRAVMTSGPVPAALAAQHPAGYWVEPGPGYYPKYQGTVWQVISLSMLGANGNDPRLRAAGEYVLEHSRSRFGGFSVDGKPGGMIHCLEGNLAAALIDLGWLGDARLSEALDWLARSITGEGIAPADEADASVRYYRGGNSGPGFQCAANAYQPCGWGAVRALRALSKLPEGAWTPAIRVAIQAGIQFLLSRDPAVADYPTPSGGKPSRSWFQPGFPIGYVTDFFMNLEVLTRLGVLDDPRLAPAIQLLLSKQDAQGRWKMEYTYNGKTWADIEEKGQPSKWVTLRALRILSG
jgi:hypothetical protein